MKLKAGQLFRADKALAKINGATLPIVASLKFSLALREIAPKIAAIEEERVGVFERHGEEIATPEGGYGRSWVIKTENAQKAAGAEIDALFSAEIDVAVEPLDVCAFVGLELSPAEFATVDWLFR